MFQRVLAGICRSPESRISEVLSRPHERRRHSRRLQPDA
jgi:hypothetical protein